MRRVALVFAVALAAAAVPATAVAQPKRAPAEPTTEYIVKSGDTCLGIAVRVLGGKEAVEGIHRVNPGLGPLPHILAPGRVMRLPRTKTTPDAKLVGRTGDIRLRTTPDGAWDPAHRNASLFHTWWVSAEPNSNAAIAFSDTKHVYLRADSVVAIDAPTLSPGLVTVSRLTLERGAIRARVAEMRGAGAMEIRTPAGTIALDAGEALVVIGGDGALTVTNLRGKPLTVRATKGRVSLRAGTTTRVAAGVAHLGSPLRPRAIAAAPGWLADTGTPTPVPAVGSAGASLTAAWSPVADATAYHVEIDGPTHAVVLSTELPASTTSITLHGVPAGRYRARVAALDAERAEGRPSPELALEVIEVAVWAPGSTAPPLVDPDADAPALAPPATSTPPPPLVVAQGTGLGGHTLTCATSIHGVGASGSPLVLSLPGKASIACTTVDGVLVASFPVEIVPVTASTPIGSGAIVVERGSHQDIAISLDSKVPLGAQWRVEPGPGLTCEGFATRERGVTIKVAVDGTAPKRSTLHVLDDRTGSRVATLTVIVSNPRPPKPTPPRVVDATPPPVLAVRTRPRVSAGAFAGWTAFPHGMESGLELGDAPVTAYQVDSGAGAGMRGALWLRREIFVELEAGLWPTGFLAADEPAWITSGHAVAGYQLADRADLGVGARVVAGGGAYALLGDAAYAEADVDPDLTWGLTGTLRLSRELTLRADGRHRIAPDRADAGVTHVVELSIGIEAVVTRTPAPR